MNKILEIVKNMKIDAKTIEVHCCICDKVIEAEECNACVIEDDRGYCYRCFNNKTKN